VLEKLRTWWTSQKQRDRELRENREQAAEASQLAQARRDADDPFSTHDSEQPITDWKPPGL
jgi:hypothetical protein